MTRTSILLVALLSIAAPAFAQPAGTPPTAAGDRADALLKEGIALGDQGKWQEARQKLEEAWALKKSYDIAGNLALVEERMGDNAAAAAHLDYALRTFPASGKPEHKATLVDKFEKLRARVGRLRITIEIEGATLSIDGVEVGRTPLQSDLFVEPGSHTIEARKEGYKTSKRQLTGEPGQTHVLSIALEKEAGGVVIEPPPTVEKPIWPYVVLSGVTAAGLGVGIGLHVASTSRIEDADGAICPGGPDTCPTNARDAESGANAMLGGAIAGYVVAGLGLGGLIGYIAWSGPEQPDTAFRVVPVVSPAATGFLLQSTF